MRLRMLEFGGQYMILKILAVFLIVILVVAKLPFVPHCGLFGNFYFLSILGIFIVVLIPTFTTGVLHYGQSPVELLRLPLMYNGLFVFAILFIYRSDERFMVQLNWLIIGLSLMGTLFAIGLSFYPEMAPTLLAKSAILPNRFGRPRFGNSMGGEAYSIFFLLTTLVERRQSRQTRSLQIAALFVFAYYLLFVYMGRGHLMTIVLSLLFFAIFHFGIHKSLPLVVALLLIVVVIEVFANNSVVEMIEEHLQSTREEFQYGDGNVGIRVDGIHYYMDKFRETGYMGIGLLSTTRASNTDIVLTMLIDKYNPADIGIFGAITQFGFPAVILMIIILIRMFCDLNIVARKGSVNHKLMASALQAFLIYNIVGMGHMFFWHKSSLEWGLYFFMTWRLRDLTEKRMRIQASTLEG